MKVVVFDDLMRYSFSLKKPDQHCVCAEFSRTLERPHDVVRADVENRLLG
jgi:hypothetical protein